MFSNLLRLKDDTGSDRPVEEEDTLALKKALKDIGRYKTPSYGDTPYPDQPMFKAIDDIQKEKNLIRDGMMKPGGETEAAINEELTRQGNRPGAQLASYPRGRGSGRNPRELDKPKDRWTDCASIQSELNQVRADLEANRNANDESIDRALGTRLMNREKELDWELRKCRAG
jgi:hypothetical protein